MKIIETIDHENYRDCTKVFKRRAVRAITFKNNKLVMIQSKKYGECKFPGGGQNQNEIDLDTLKRELLEETGLELKDETVTLYGLTTETRKSAFESDTKFEMTSVYYLCETKDEINSLKLDDYENDYGYHMILVDIDDAIRNNEALIDHKKEIVNQFIPWTERELVVLKDLRKTIKR